MGDYPTDADLVGCPFCGAAPVVLPKHPEREGDTWNKVVCFNPECAVQPSVAVYTMDGEDPADRRAKYLAAWNGRV